MRTWIVAALTLLPAALVFAPGLHYPFLSLDDVHHIVENPILRDLSWHGIGAIFSEDTRDARYFPLTYLSLAFDWRLFHLDPFGYHLHNLVLHGANTLLVLALVKRLTGDLLAAAVTALLFSIHPLQVESVAWIISRKNVLFLFFFLLGIHAYLAYQGERGRRRWAALVAASLLYLLACLAKTTALTLPAVLLLIDWYRDPTPLARPVAFLRRALPSKLAFVPPLAMLAVAAQAAVRRNPFETSYPFAPAEWIAIAGHNFFFYVAKALVPLQLGVFYPLPAAGAVPTYFTAFTAGTVLLLVLTVWSFSRERRSLAFGLGWYFVTIAPLAVQAALFSDLPLLAADRYFYQSSIGLFFPVGIGASALWRRRLALRPPLAAVAALALVALCTLAAQQRAAFRSTIALYEVLLAHHPSDEFYYRLAIEYAAAGRREDAFRALAGAEQAPNRIFFMHFLYYEFMIADLYRQKGDLRAAASHLEAGIEATPNEVERRSAATPFAWLYLADLRERAGDLPGAAAARERAATAKPDPEQLFENTWIASAPDEAEAFLQRHVERRPEDGEAWYRLAVLAERTGHPELARRRLHRAAALGYAP
jgi:tetratricopeptide (TPR) repeat protein